jgi:hypothetical protein
MLLGPPGVGKTYSLSTLVEAGLKCAFIFTDPGGEESLIDACEARKLPLDNVHWRYVAPTAMPWSTLEEMTKKITSMGYEDLTKLKSGVDKRNFTQFAELLGTLANFKCERTGAELGPVDDLDASWVVAIDSLSGINIMAMDMMIGAKPAAHQGEWGVAINAEEKLIYKLTSDLSCFFVLTAHVERERDEVIGREQLMASALGRRLAPKLPRTFSDVVLAQKEADKFTWSTATLNVDLKSRSLPLSASLEPSFVPIVKRFRERVALASKPAPVAVATQ